MKTIIRFSPLILAFLYLSLNSVVLAQTNRKVASVSAAELSKLRAAVERTQDDVEAHRAYIDGMGIENPELEKQYDLWTKKHPTSSVFPLAIGQRYYERELPQAKHFLLKAAALKPADAKIWSMLSTDAQRWGDISKAQEYMGRASSAEPTNVDYPYYHASLFMNTDPEKWKKMTWALVDKFPGNERVAGALSIMGFFSPSLDETIQIYEKMRPLFSDTIFFKAVAMNRLVEAYIQRGEPEKAMKLAAAMPERPDLKRLRFAEMGDVARKINNLKNSFISGRLDEARNMLPLVNMAAVSAKGIDVGNYLVLLSASVLNATGSVQDAYDTLLVFQSKKPDDSVQATLNKYGSQLGKSQQQVSSDVKKAVYRNAKPSPDFNLGLYTSKAKLRLADLKGKVTLLTFWFPGCGPCRAEMPYFQQVVNKFKKQDLAFIGINVAPEQNDYVLSFMKGTGYTFVPLKADMKWAQEKFAIRGAPTNFIIDQNGKIVYSNFLIHANDTRMLELMIKSLM